MWELRMTVDSSDAKQSEKGALIYLSAGTFTVDRLLRTLLVCLFETKRVRARHPLSIIAAAVNCIPARCEIVYFANGTYDECHK